jgi:hypothetical protein
VLLNMHKVLIKNRCMVSLMVMPLKILNAAQYLPNVACEFPSPVILSQ